MLSYDENAIKPDKRGYTRFESCCENCVKNWFQYCLPDDDQIDESSSINENRESSPQIPPIAIHQLSNIETGKDLTRSKIPRVAFPSSSQMQASNSKSGMGDGMADEIDCESMKTNIARFTSNNESFIDTSYNNPKSNNTLTTNKDYAETIRNGNKNRNCIITIPEKIVGNQLISVPLNDLRPKVNQKLNDKDSGNTRFMKEKATQYQQIQNIENFIDERILMLLKNTSPENRGKKTSKCTTGRSNDSMTSLFKYDKMQYVSEWIQETNGGTNFGESMSNERQTTERGIRNQCSFRRYGRQHGLNEGMNFNANSPVRDRFGYDRHLKRKGIIADHSQKFLYSPVRDRFGNDRHLKRKCIIADHSQRFLCSPITGKEHCRDKKPTVLGIAPNRLLFDAADFGYIIGEIGSKLIENKNIDYNEPGKKQITNNISVVSSIKFRERKNVDPKKNQDAILRDKTVTMKSPQV
ncbi:hypothetical protein TNIN_78911 [Trichonephila inaurata madagascariensis]|uniref:Uncharacterized protein n=1 Tax=Trichonephila inaurata madagascariensis TaxID=2747483 RepID=A0A8X6IGS6_9ARAC|nr:hypothetical protein TNIN_78911 [Trichonephila inaurata madagascariensis]